MRDGVWDCLSRFLLNGIFPSALVLIGFALALAHPLLGVLWAVVVGTCWALWRGFIALGDYFSVEATEERKRADHKRSQQAEDEAYIDWGLRRGPGSRALQLHSPKQSRRAI
jgi:hypothetical protein